ncbi:myosin-IIIB [Elysia marginata]|uniref:Myosin-IIIB n=1 Tax=Elysia marginata TaxID=1093978 RepID=A0AAV4HE03_9GAST|nr:myosin-IIIB [Elysia marginata]
MEPYDDLSRLHILDEATVLYYLKTRYFADKCYTFLGDVLVALNPNKNLHIYDKEYHERYGLDSLEISHTSTQPPSLSLTSKQPHIFWTAQQSYLNLVQTQTNQCVLEVNNVLTILAAILHLTNISFQESGDGADSVTVNDEEALASGASLLCVDMTSLQDALISNTISVRGEDVKQMKKLHQAHDGRDALAKTLYSRLFGWIVSHINDNLAQDESNWENTRTLSILDFAGFERFQRNTLDQLCINVANERLHSFFCHHIFTMEQQDLEAQGVKAELVEFKDNQKLIDLFFQKRQGLFYLLDEESSFPQATDSSFVAKLNSACASNDHFLPVRSQAHGFTIVHYAGQVLYDARGMLERNRDRLGPHLESTILNSTNEMVKLLFTTKEPTTGSYSRSFSAMRTRSNLPHVTTNLKESVDKLRSSKLSSNGANDKDKYFVSRYFRKSLSELVGKLDKSKPWFVRCVRPNAKSLPGTFNDALVTSQLRYNGLLEIAKIRRDGFPIRLSFHDFLQKYKDIWTSKDDCLDEQRWKVEKLLNTVGTRGWALGHSMVFLQHSAQEKLSERLDLIRKRRLKEQERKLQEEIKRKRAEETARMAKTRNVGVDGVVVKRETIQ